MKTLYLVRHAKSSWKNPILDDFDRPLNSRGKYDAPMMGKILREANKIPDLILSSSAKRAKKTAQKLAQQFDYQKNKIVFNSNIYHADSQEVLNIIQKQSDTIQKLMLVGHNPDLTELANFLTHFNLENLPTCGIFEIRFETEKWENISVSNAHFVSFEYPKKYKA